MLMARKAVIVGGAIVLVLFIAGTFLIINSLAPLEKNDVLLSDSFSVPGNNYEYRTAVINSSGEYVASFAVSSGVIKFYFFDEATFPMWQEGQFEPSWVEADTAGYGMSITLGAQRNYLEYFVFLNENSIEKEVHLQFARVWNESNYIGLLSGAAIIATGIIIGLVTTSKLK
jgi:hypothetical protein